MTSAPEPTVVRLNQLSDIVEAVPYLLGFVPRDSIVAVALRGRRERLHFTMRFDLTDPTADTEVAQMVGQRMRLACADSVLLFVYADTSPAGGSLPRRALVDAIDGALTVPLRDALYVTDDRIWSYVCDEAGCCPPEGRPRSTQTPGALALSAAHALSGRGLLPDRAAVVASLSPADGRAAAAMRRAVRRAESAALEPAAVRRLARSVRDRYAERPDAMSDDEAAQLIVGMDDVGLRDEMLGWCTSHPDAMRSVFGDLARRAVPPRDAPACTALAWSAYTQGEGLVAGIALERALGSDPGYTLAGLLADALDGQVPPAKLREAAVTWRPA